MAATLGLEPLASRASIAPALSERRGHYAGRMAQRNDLFMKSFGTLHRTIFRASKGKLLNKGFGMPMLTLTTTGRKSGQERMTMLSSPLQLGDSIVIVASKGGDDRDPVWFLNLVANPNVKVEMGGAVRSMVARIADGDERSELWQQLSTAHTNYAGYQTKTDRLIPVVVLDPLSA